jgi:hypothetical protein
MRPVTPVPRRSPHRFPRRFLGLYGGSPLHLAGQLACFLVAGYAAVQLLGARPAAVLLWFVGAAVLNDILLAPLYLLVDRTGRRRRGFPSWWNHVRVPAAVSLLLLLVWFPEIARRSHSYTRLSGLDASPYVGRWLAVTGALFVLSALALGLGRVRAARRRRSGGEPAADRGDPGAGSAE